ncbi:SDR family oxidoreductase [uncultured Sphingomonas sp.]|uniref:SDR family oxidoreductase n=1 Tax=uncultured Sphingomonas sp. TaxID=158754 RepID=UPI0025E5CE8A|nr:SDR family oxidoreductase [uncultured Sphingomonas sp.]
MLALVTGGLTRLGAAIAARLAEDGYDLALHGRGGGALDAPAPALEQAGTKWARFAADLADGTAVESLLPRVTDHFGRAPDLLVNNAALFEEGDWTDLSRDVLERHLAVNLTAPLLLTRALAAAGGRAVVNIVDQRIVNPPVDQAAYTASKLALGAITRVAARAFAPMRINAVAPGLTIPGDEYQDDQIDRLARAMPLARLPSPDQVADAVAYLAGAQAVTGQTLFVDGGATLESYKRDFVHLASR